MGVERLARALALSMVEDRIYGGKWFGWPDPDDQEEMEQAIELHLSDVRERAERYAALVLEEDS